MSLSLPPILAGPLVEQEAEEFVSYYSNVQPTNKTAQVNVVRFEPDQNTFPQDARCMSSVTAWCIVKWILIVVLVVAFVVFLFFKLRSVYRPIAKFTQSLHSPSIFALNPNVRSTYPSIVGLPEVVRGLPPLSESETNNRRFTPRLIAQRLVGMDFDFGDLVTQRSVDQGGRLLAQQMFESSDRSPAFVSSTVDALVIRLLNSLTISPSQLSNLSRNVRIFEQTNVLPNIGPTLSMSSYFPLLKTINASTDPTLLDVSKLATGQYPVVLYPDKNAMARSFVQVRANLWRGVLPNLNAPMKQQQIDMGFAMAFNQQLRNSWMRPTQQQKVQHPEHQQLSSPLSGVVRLQYNNEVFDDPASFLVALTQSKHQVRCYVRTKTHDFLKLLLLPSEESQRLEDTNSRLQLQEKGRILAELGARGNYKEVPTAVMVRTGIAAQRKQGSSVCLFPAIEASYVIDVQPLPGVPEGSQVRFRLAMQPNLPFGGTGFWPATSLETEGSWIGEKQTDAIEGLDAALSVYYAQTIAIILNFIDSKFRVQLDTLGAYSSAINNDFVSVLEQILFDNVSVYPCTLDLSTFQTHLTSLKKNGSLSTKNIRFFNTLYLKVEEKLAKLPNDTTHPVDIDSVSKRILSCTPYPNANSQVFIVGKETIEEMQSIQNVTSSTL